MMSETILFPDAVATIVTLLTTELSPTPVRTQVPNPRPSSFVIVRRVGGTLRNLVVDQATLTVETWADTEKNAHDLSQLARAAIHKSLGQVTSAGTLYIVEEFAGPAYLPDQISSQHRYTITVSIGLRGNAS